MSDLFEHSYSLSLPLAVIGTVSGIAWVVLGIRALSYLPDADEHDRTYGWTLWWFLQEERYTAPGKRLCQYGWVAFVIGLAAWLGAYAAR